MANYGKAPPRKIYKEGGRPRCKGMTVGKTTNGVPTRCPFEELPDLGYCWVHAPDALIPEAERISGIKRCVNLTSGLNWQPGGHKGERCGNVAYPGSDKCRQHGAITSKNGDARRNAFEEILDGKAAQIIPQFQPGRRSNGANQFAPGMPPAPPGTPPGRVVPPLPDGEPPKPVENPFLELLQVAGEMKAYKDRLATYVAHLSVEQFRYEHDRAGEQLDANVALYAQSMERLSVCLTRIAKLNIEERMVRISERQQQIIENAIGRTIEDLGLPPAMQKQARTAVVRRLRAA